MSEILRFVLFLVSLIVGVDEPAEVEPVQLAPAVADVREVEPVEPVEPPAYDGSTPTPTADPVAVAAQPGRVWRCVDDLGYPFIFGEGEAGISDELRSVCEPVELESLQ